MSEVTSGRPSPKLVSVVIPAYNEERTLGAHLRDILAYGAAQPWDLEILVVDDGSSDRTVEITLEAERRHSEVRLLRQSVNIGKGSAVRRGLRAAKGDIRGFTDADAATEIVELERILPAFQSGARFVIGSRAKHQEGVSVEAKLHRKIIGRSFNALLRFLLGMKDADGRAITDTQCGFKWLTGEACEALLAHAFVDGFAFDVELIYLANRLGLEIREVPINWTDRGASSVNLLTEPARMLMAALAVRRRHRHLGP